MGDYIKMPCTAEQYEQIEPLIKLTKGWSEHTTILAGSSALRIFLGKPQEFSNDIDLWVCSKLNVNSWVRELSKTVECYPSRFAVNVIRDELPIQFIPVDIYDVEGLLDTFDLTGGAIGVNLTEEELHFTLHKDLYAYYLGVLGPLHFTLKEPSLALFFRAIKYAEKFNIDVERIFPEFAKYLYAYMGDNNIKLSFDEFKARLILEEAIGKYAQNYEDNELLAEILTPKERNVTRVNIFANMAAIPWDDDDILL